MPTIASIHISAGGVPKRAVETARITRLGLEGDRQNNTVHHGGPERAVCLYSLEVIQALAAEGHPIAPGSTGENLTIAGLDWPSLGPGSQLQVGNDCVLEITSYTTPCKTIAASFVDGDFSRILQSKHPGHSRLYARVNAEGQVHTSDAVQVLLSNQPQSFNTT